MDDHATAPRDPFPTISVRCERPGLVLAVRGRLDGQLGDLLGEVVRAALVAVKRAHRIHLDLSAAFPSAGPVPRIVDQLARAGAQVTFPSADAAVMGVADGRGRSVAASR